MRVLITWGSSAGGTEGIARIIGETLGTLGIDATLRAAREIRGVDAFDAVIVGGAVYANRWHRDARAFVTRNLPGLRTLPVWLFSSGPLDASADATELPPVREVAVLVDRVGALGHVTFGGRLDPAAKGAIASSMAKTSAGDWRNPARIRAWATAIAAELPEARPGHAFEPPARSPVRTVVYGLVPSAICALLGLAWPIAQAIATPVVFGVFAHQYFRAPASRDPLPTAGAFAALSILASLGTHRAIAPVMLWLVPLAFLVVWAVGFVHAVILPLRTAAASTAVRRLEPA